MGVIIRTSPVSEFVKSPVFCPDGSKFRHKISSPGKPEFKKFTDAPVEFHKGSGVVHVGQAESEDRGRPQ